MSAQRISTLFHESFALSLPSLMKIMALSHRTNGQLTPSMMRSELLLGPNYVKAMPRYGRACGMLEMDTYSLTVLGRSVADNDPDLSRDVTWWLMHYHLSAPQGPGPLFWSELVRRALPFRDEMPRRRVDAKLTEILGSQPGAKALQPRSIESTVTVFLGTYTKSDALGGLGLLRQVGERDSARLIVSGPKAPPPFVVGYALADYWDAFYADQVTVTLNELTRDDGFGRALWMDAHQLEVALDVLRREGLLGLNRDVPPYNVVKRWSGKADFEARLYG